jgi:hypothetical protein
VIRLDLTISKFQVHAYSIRPAQYWAYYIMPPTMPNMPERAPTIRTPRHLPRRR